jgi:hypothetical protein
VFILNAEKSSVESEPVLEFAKEKEQICMRRGMGCVAGTTLLWKKKGCI